MIESVLGIAAVRKVMEAIRRLVWPPSASTKVAVLIDGDNVSPRVVPALFNHVARIGDPTVRRVYTNIAGKGNKWSPTMGDRSLSPVHVSSVSLGKNAADIALTVDAMDLLNSGRVNAFAIVSSDADYTRLATRIREEGHVVHGYGDAHTPASFQRACSSFKFFNELGPGGASGAGGAGKWKLAPTDAEATLVLAVLRLGGGLVDVDLSKLGEHLRRHEPHFDPRVYRCRTLGELLGKLESFDVVTSSGVKSVRLRIGGARNQSTSVPR